MKKLLAMILILTMVLALSACGGKEEPPAEKEETPVAEEVNRSSKNGQ